MQTLHTPGTTDSPTRVNKALLPWANARLIDAVADRLVPQCSELWINAPEPLEGVEAFKQVPDVQHAGAGPLAGLLAGLLQLKADSSHREWLLSVPCDTPLLPLDLADQLARPARHQQTLSSPPVLPPSLAFARIATTVERAHPVIGLWHVSHCAALAGFLAAGGFKVHAWVSTIQAISVTFPDENAFANLNTLEQWAHWHHRTDV